jgi:hypothetical protein
MRNVFTRDRVGGRAIAAAKLARWPFTLLALLATANGAHSQELQFDVRCTVLAAIEDGPVAILITRTNTGQRALEFVGSEFWFPTCLIQSGPGKWRKPDFVASWNCPIIGDPRRSAITFKAGASEHDLARLDRWYGTLPAGKYAIEVEVAMDGSAMGFKPEDALTYRGAGNLARNGRTVLIHQEIQLEVLPATDVNLRKLSMDLGRLLDDRKSDPNEIRTLANVLSRNRHPQLCPLMFRLLHYPETTGLHGTIVRDLLNCPAQAEQNREELLAYMSQRNCVAALGFFGAFRGEELSGDHKLAESLMRSASPWVRAGLYLHAPEKSEGQWLKQLLAELYHVKEPIPTAKLTPYLKDLGADQFLTRRKAAEELQAMGEGVVPGLLQLSHDPKLTPEQAASIDRVIKELREKPDPFEEYALKHIETEGLYHGKAKEAIRILQALAENDPELYISQQAKKLLAQMVKARK